MYYISGGLTKDGTNKSYISDNFLTSENAINEARKLLNNCVAADSDQEYSFFVRDEKSGRFPVAVATNARIIGKFHKEAWSCGNKLIAQGTVPFDATDYVLGMKYYDFLDVVDGMESSDIVGMAHVQWEGPCSVTITDSIRDFFGVYELNHIMPNYFEFVKNEYAGERVEQTVTMTIQLKVMAPKDADLGNFVNDLDYHFNSNTAGFVVKDTEVVDAQFEYPEDISHSP